MFHAAGMKEMETAGDVERDLPAARRPGVQAGGVLGERPPEVASLPRPCKRDSLLQQMIAQGSVGASGV